LALQASKRTPRPQPRSNYSELHQGPSPLPLLPPLLLLAPANIPQLLHRRLLAKRSVGRSALLYV